MISTAPREGVLGFRCGNTAKSPVKALGRRSQREENALFPMDSHHPDSEPGSESYLHSFTDADNRESEGLVGLPKVTQLGRFTLRAF